MRWRTFVMLTLNGPDIHVDYVDEDDRLFHIEDWDRWTGRPSSGEEVLAGISRRCVLLSAHGLPLDTRTVTFQALTCQSSIPGMNNRKDPNMPAASARPKPRKVGCRSVAELDPIWGLSALVPT
jgi:hypothetical protein